MIKKIKNNNKEIISAQSLQRVRRSRKVTVNSNDNMDVNDKKIVADFIHKIELNRKSGVGNSGPSQSDMRRKRAENVHRAIDPVKRPNER